MPNATSEILPRLLSEQQASHYLSLSRSYLRKSRIGLSSGPPFVRVSGGRAIRYDRFVLDQWIEQNAQSCPAGAE